MFQKGKLVSLLTILLLGIVIAVSACIYPLGLISIRKQDAALEKGMAVSGTITEDTPIAVIFRPACGGLESLSLRFYVPDSADNPGTLRFLLKDQKDVPIFETIIPISSMKNNQYYEFSGFGQALNPGEPYVFELNAYNYGDTPPCLYFGSPDVASIEHQAVYHNGLELPGNAPIAIYTYRTKASFTDALPYLILLSAFALLGTAAILAEDSHSGHEGNPFRFFRNRRDCHNTPQEEATQ